MAAVTVTKYVLAVFTVMLGEVAPVLQRKAENVPGTEKVAFPVAQIWEGPLIVATGGGKALTLNSSVAVQPKPSVTVTP